MYARIECVSNVFRVCPSPTSRLLSIKPTSGLPLDQTSRHIVHFSAWHFWFSRMFEDAKRKKEADRKNLGDLPFFVWALSRHVA